ncbi:MAG: hypothetical protein WBE26_06395 [Phycisphaerae bacterium]
MVRAPSARSVLVLGTLAAAIGLAGDVRAQPLHSPTPSPDRNPMGTAHPASLNRIVHRFDFDERAAGNLEDVPKYWDPVRRPRFPHFAYGAFDFAVGRLAPPSFHLAGEGRNVAYQYIGPETRVRPNTDYLIEGYVRGDRLKHARACLSAYFLDKYARPMVETLVRSRYVGGSSDGDDWIKVELYLVAAPAKAHAIGLVAWVLQEPLWSTSLPTRRHIPRSDVLGGAWFDDLTIYALPRVQITTSAPGNVLIPGEPQELHVVLADNEDATLQGKVSITAADGSLVETHPVSVAIDSAEPTRIPVNHLSPGLYHARLDVTAGTVAIASRTLAFARLGKRYGDSEAVARPFGVVVDPQSRSDATTELALLRYQVVGSAKLPVWTGLPKDPPTPKQRRATDRLLQDLVRSGFALTGVFVGPPSAIVRSDGAYVRPLIELLAGDPGVWTEHLAAVVAPYASAFRWWQVGPDAPKVDSPVASLDQLVLAVTQLRDAMGTFITIPLLSVPTSTSVEPAGQKLPAGQITLTIGSEIQPGWFASQLQRFETPGYEHVSAYVEALPEDQYRRLPRLADWAQRIITARHAGADTVFVPQTWRVRQTMQGVVTEPTEEYLILRTIADVITDAIPGPRLRLDEGVQCLAFYDGDSAILAMWDPHASPTGNRYAIQLGQADRQIDLWGVSAPLGRDEHGRQIVLLSPTPILVPGVERWLIEFRTSLVLKPAHVESGLELVRHRVEMAYKGDRPVLGLVVLDGPASCNVSPRSFSFSLMPRRQGSHTVEVRYPHNEPAGKKRIVARITLPGDSYYLEVPLAVDVGLTDVVVWGLALTEGNNVVLRHVVTNHSQDVLSFRGSADVPGRERQYRPFFNLRPGDTQGVEYRFRGAGDLVGRNARLGLREMNDGPRIHNLELVVP